MNNTMNTLTLEKYKGTGSRHTCPACGRAKRFTRYIDTETGRYIDDHVGRCDRESSCGYHYPPKEYFAENAVLEERLGWRRQNLTKPHFWGLEQHGPRGENWSERRGRTLQNLRKPKIRGILKSGSHHEDGSERDYEGRLSTKRPDCIEPESLMGTLTDYDQNGFVQFLLELFRGDPQSVWQAVNDYMIGTTKGGKTIFWQIDTERRIRTGKTISYEAATGRRRKDVNPNWIHSEMKKAGLLKPDFELQQCFFGEHLLPFLPDLPIAITEAEKSAVIGSICKSVFPDLVWLACGGKSNLNAERLARLGRNRTIILYPDADGFERWQLVASDALKAGLTVNVSDLIEKHATDAEKAKGYDLADYLVREQGRRNDPANREAFRELIEERLAIMIIDGGLSGDQAEAVLETSRYYHDAIRSILN